MMVCMISCDPWLLPVQAAARSELEQATKAAELAQKNQTTEKEMYICGFFSICVGRWLLLDYIPGSV